MRPEDRDLDDEIRGHLALSTKERIERGEDPEVARLAALREFGYVPAIRDSMRHVWYGRWFDAAAALSQEMRLGLRSLRSAKALAATVVVTLGLGIGANVAVFSVVRDVLLRPLVNRDPDRLVYIRQSAPALEAGNTTFSVPEIQDLRSRVRTIASFAELSPIDLPLTGVGEPRAVKAGIVSGSYLHVLGLRPLLGRVIDESDDGVGAAGVVVLTHRFWSTALAADPAAIGRTVRLGSHPATVVGVLEPSLGYPAQIDLVANMVTSAHHLGATMRTERTHRMTELVGRLAPGATLEEARRELAAVHAGMMREHPDAYDRGAGMQVAVMPLREQITAPARTILLVLLAAAAAVFGVASANVATLMRARALRRHTELRIRAALGASSGALRRTLVAESLVLCGAGAAAGMLLAWPLATVVGGFAGRFSLHPVSVTVDPYLLGIGAGLTIVSALVLAYIPRLPQPRERMRVSGGHAGGAGPARPRLRLFAVTQIALSFVLLTAAGTVLASLLAIQRTNTGLNVHEVLAFDIPMPLEFYGPNSVAFVDRLTGELERLPAVRRVAVGNHVPWRDADRCGGVSPFAADGNPAVAVPRQPHAQMRNVSPGFFTALGIPILAGRSFTEEDRAGGELVVIVSEGLARQVFPAGDALERRLWWTAPIMGRPHPRRIVGIVPDVQDVKLAGTAAPAIYQPFAQTPCADRLFVQAAGDPYALVAPVTQVIRRMSPDQPVERAATLADIRAELLAPERLKAMVVCGFGGVAVLITITGLAGVLTMSAGARTREFGLRRAVGATRRDVMVVVLSEGAMILAIGLLAGAVGSLTLGRLVAGYLGSSTTPEALTAAGAAVVLTAAAAAAALLPARRASRVDVTRALRSE